MNKTLKHWRIVLLTVSLALSLTFITNLANLNKGRGFGFGNGLDYGLDFAGGTQLQLKLESEVSSEIMAVEKGILENRLNSMGLKDIPVRPWGSQYLLIQIADATPEETENIEGILKQQARFEERIDGELAIKGDEVTVDLGPRGTSLYKVPGGYSWSVSVSHSKEGACRFGAVGDGRRGRPVDIFIDRPVNTSIVFARGDYQLLLNLTERGESDRFFFGDSALWVVENRSAIPVTELTSTTRALDELLELKSSGYHKVVLAGGVDRIPDELRNMLEEEGFDTERKAQQNMSYIRWVSELVSLQSSPRLDFDTRGECVYDARITGSTGTLEDAQLEVQRNQILLTSGNLPVGLTIESKSTTPPTLGRRFLGYSFYTGLVAIAVVALIVYVRYRRVEIVVPVMLTGVSEILLILGLAAFINWELDLPAVAGIIAAVGTGVDHQIVITDETLKHAGKKKLISIAERIRRAFFIIFTAAATTIAAMVPLMSIGAGMLKGFAFTTIMGVLIGITITRPAYARVIEGIIRKSE
jgi:preprotein translocase subunit SecD